MQTPLSDLSSTCKCYLDRIGPDSYSALTKTLLLVSNLTFLEKALKTLYKDHHFTSMNRIK